MKAPLIACLLLAAFGVTASPGSDSRCDRHDNLSVHREKNLHLPGMAIFQPAATTDTKPTALIHIRWNYSPEALYRLIWSYEKFPEYIPNVKHSRVLESRQGQVWVYQRLQFPGPVRDRHYVITSTDSKSEPQRSYYRVDWILEKHYPVPVEGRLIVPDSFTGCWDIRPGKTQGLDALYWIELEPGGLLPDWLFQTAMRRYLTDLMDALQRQLQSAHSTGR